MLANSAGRSQALRRIVRAARLARQRRQEPRAASRRKRTRSMFIQTEQTPNPATLKFLPGVVVMDSGVADFASVDEAAASPLAQVLFAIEGVQGVFLGHDFISVTKASEKEWFLLKPSILGTVMEHFTAGRPVMLNAGEASSDDAEQVEGLDGEIVAQIRELIDTRVRPAVAMDGGDIVFRGFEAGVVYLSMHGACQGCPSSTATLKIGIENMLKHYIPEVVEVRPV